MEFFGGFLSWCMLLTIVGAVAILAIALLYRSKRGAAKEMPDLTKDEDIQLLLKEIMRLRNYAQLLEEKIEEEKVVA